MEISTLHVIILEVLIGFTYFPMRNFGSQEADAIVSLFLHHGIYFIKKSP